jgi:hypothetical protein
MLVGCTWSRSLAFLTGIDPRLLKCSSISSS